MKRPKAEMEVLRVEALDYIKRHPKVSMAHVARFFRVSDKTVSKWFDEAGLKRWF